VFRGIYCAGKEETFAFLQDVLAEVMDLFPGKYIHIGGDEVPQTVWSACPNCRARMAAQGLTSAAQLQSYFLKRIQTFVNARGKTIIGWDEILDGGTPPGATVMLWQGIDRGVRAANAGHDVIMSPGEYCYFDNAQARTGEPRGIGGFIPLERVYGWEPVPADVAPANVKRIIGVQANLWSEYIPNFQHLEYMAFPRACALAEVAWSPPAPGAPRVAGATRDIAAFRRRLAVQLLRLDQAQVNYRHEREQ
jgi:hexosaminidase